MNFTGKYKFWVWTKNVMGTKIENGNWGKMTQVSKSYQETFNGFTEEKNDLYKPPVHGFVKGRAQEL